MEKGTIIPAVFVVCFIAILASVVDWSDHEEQTPPDDSSPIYFPIGKVAQFELPENTSTGYRWVFEVPEGVSLTVTHVAPNSGLLGASGKCVVEVTSDVLRTFVLSGEYVGPTGAYGGDFEQEFVVVPSIIDGTVPISDGAGPGQEMKIRIRGMPSITETPLLISDGVIFR